MRAHSKHNAGRQLQGGAVALGSAAHRHSPRAGDVPSTAFRGARMSAAQYLSMLDARLAQSRESKLNAVQIQTLRTQVRSAKEKLDRTSLEAAKLGRFAPLGQRAEGIALELVALFDRAELLLNEVKQGTAADPKANLEAIATAGMAACEQASEFMRLASPSAASAAAPSSAGAAQASSAKRKSPWKPGPLRAVLTAELERAEKHQIATSELLERLQVLAELGELAATVAHDIRAPLSAIVGFAQLAAAGVNPDNHKAMLRHLPGSIATGREIANGLLDVSRGRRRELEPVDVTASVSRAVKLIKGLLMKSQVRLEVDLPTTGAPLTVLGDPCDLGRVVIQLAKNAKEAFGDQAGERKLTIRARPEGDAQVRIEVADNGPGIEPTIRDRLFQDFVTTKSASEGTGLGLFGARKIVDRQQGQIRVESEPGSGATFIITLPRMTGSA